MGKEIYKTMISDSEPNVSETRKTRSQSLQYSFLMALGQKLRPFFASGPPLVLGKTTLVVALSEGADTSPHASVLNWDMLSLTI